MFIRLLKASLLASVLFMVACSGSKSEFEFKLLPVKLNEKWGYVDNSGKILINPQFDEAFLFADGLALVKTAGKYGYIDKDGNVIINPMYMEAMSFRNGKALVVGENTYPTFINKKGEIIFTVNEADECRHFSEDLAAFKSNFKWGFIDESGKIIINAQFDRVGDFSEGLAMIGNEGSPKMLFGYINKKGEMTINPQFDQANEFIDGMALVKLNDKYGYIDTEGKFIINAQFDEAAPFADGLARVKVGDKYGFIDKSGKIVINPQFEKVGSFSEGLALVISEDNKVGYINKEGAFHINVQFEEAHDFNNKMAPVKMNDKYGFIDNNGKIIVNPQFDAVYDMRFYTNTIQSDFFNTKSLTAFFTESTNETMFRTVTKNTTFGDVSNVVHKTDKLLESSNNSVTVELNTDIDNYAKIENFKYVFASNVYTIKPTYQYLHHWGNYQTGTKKDMNFAATVASVEAEMYLYGKASGKNDKITRSIANAFGDALKTKATPATNGYEVEGAGLKVFITAENKAVTGKIYVKVVFK
jgi:hypothetical protein